MNLFPALGVFAAFATFTVVDAIPEPGFTAGRTYCAMRKNGASHADAFSEIYKITNADGKLTPEQQGQEMQIFALVVLNECNQYKRDFGVY